MGARLKAGLGFRVSYDLKCVRQGSIVKSFGFRVACFLFRFWCSVPGCRTSNLGVCMQVLGLYRDWVSVL